MREQLHVLFHQGGEKKSKAFSLYFKSSLHLKKKKK